MAAVNADPTLDRLARVLGDESDVVLAIAVGSVAAGTSSPDSDVDVGDHLLADTERQAPETMGETFDLLAAEGMLDADLARRMRAAIGRVLDEG